jgi:hypothetical protein
MNLRWGRPIVLFVSGSAGARPCPADRSGLRQSSGRRGCGLHERDRVRIEVGERKFLKELFDKMLPRGGHRVTGAQVPRALLAQPCVPKLAPKARRATRPRRGQRSSSFAR